MRPTRDDIIDLDAWAEDSFAVACAKCGVTRNKSYQDRTGWDWLVEFPPPNQNALPVDKRQIEATARVQIKSKRSGKPQTILKLSNALRFVKDPLPCFLVLYQASKGTLPVKVYAKHFGEAEMALVLKRAREVDSTQANETHKIKVAFSFTAADEHTDDLIEWMAGCVAAGGERYVEAKLRQARTLGYEDGGVHGNFTINFNDLQALVDHQIGLIPEAPSLNVKIKDRRFGIDAASSIFEGVPDLAHMRSHPQACRLRVRGVNGDTWLDGQLFLPAIPGLPLKVCKARVQADFVQIILAGNEDGKVEFDLAGDRQRSLPSLRAAARVLEASHTGPVNFQIGSDDGEPFSFSAEMPIQFTKDELKQLSNVVACFEKVTSGILPPNLTMSFDEIDNAWNEIVDFNGMVAGTDMKATFTLDREIPDDIDPVSTMFLYDYVDVGGWAFLAVVRRGITKFSISGNTGYVEYSEPSVVEAMVRQGAGAQFLPDIQKFYEDAVRGAGKGVLQVHGGDYRRIRACEEGGAVFAT